MNWYSSQEQNYLNNFSLRIEEQIKIFSVYLGFYKDLRNETKSLGSHGRNLSREEKIVTQPKLVPAKLVGSAIVVSVLFWESSNFTKLLTN